MEINADSAARLTRRLLVLSMLAFSPSAVHGQAEQDASDWAWDQIRAGQIADFNVRCTKELDPRQDAGWDDECRHIPSKFLQDVLADPSRQAQAPRHRVRLRGARIDGPLDLAGADISGEVWIDASRIDGDLDLAGSNWTRNFSLEGSLVAGVVHLGDAKIGGQFNLSRATLLKTFNASGLSVASDLFMDGASLGGDVILRDAKIAGQLDMTGASLARALSVEGVSVGRNFVIGNGASFDGDVILRDAKIGGQFDITGALFAKAVAAGGVNVGGNFDIGDGASFVGDVTLRDAKIGGELDMSGASFTKTLFADGVNVGGGLSIRSDSRFKDEVNLVGARVGNLSITHATFDKTLDATSLNVRDSLVLYDGATFNGEVILTFAEVGGSLSLFNHVSFAGKLVAGFLIVGRNLVTDQDVTFNDNVNLGAARFGGDLLLSGTFASLELTGAVVARELNILDVGWRCGAAASLHWPLGDQAWEHAACASESGGPSLILRNVQAGSFQDDVSVWPPVLDLEGFHYERIGGFRGTGRHDMRTRSLEQWGDWLARDGTFSTQPYVQLAGALFAAGRRDTAERIQFAMRERERGEAWRRGDWAQWAWLTTLCFVAGYGIGLFTFRVLWWVLALNVLGALVLQFSPNARRHGLLWRFGASLHRLLPLVELNKGFKDFFDNPAPSQLYEPRNLSYSQSAFFAGFAIAGWILGIFLIAALGGLMPKG